MKVPDEKVCHDPSNELLPWYLNGSLEPLEAERVRAHLDACDVCPIELDELASFAGAFANRDAGPADQGASPGRTARRGAPWLALAAAAAVIVAALLLWSRWGGESGPSPPVEVAIVSVDLGAGPMRGQPARASLRLERGTAQVDFVFTPPVNPEATYEVEIQDPRGRIAFRGPRARLDIDRDGRSRIRVHAEVLSISGDCLLRLREFAAGGEVHEYSYPFRIIAPDRD